MDERIWPLLLVFVIVNAVGVVDGAMWSAGKRWADSREDDSKFARGCSLVVVGLVLTAPIMLLAAWADMILWNMVAPTLDLPQIDLLTSLAIGWLIALLFKGITPMRVRVMGTLD